jgi:hypothetical protein
MKLRPTFWLQQQAEIYFRKTLQRTKEKKQKSIGFHPKCDRFFHVSNIIEECMHTSTEEVIHGEETRNITMYPGKVKKVEGSTVLSFMRLSANRAYFHAL